MTTLETINLIARLTLAAFGIYLICKIEVEAIRKDINGKGLATAIGVILAIILATLGVHIQDVLFK